MSQLRPHQAELPTEFIYTLLMYLKEQDTGPQSNAHRDIKRKYNDVDLAVSSKG
jgi:hypothetical protein